MARAALTLTLSEKERGHIKAVLALSERERGHIKAVAHK